MPSRAPSRCPCGVITAAGTLCPCRARRRQAAKAQADARRPNAAARGYDGKWRRESREWLSRPEHRVCARCKKAPATVVHHIIPHRLGRARTEAERQVALKLFMRRSNWLPVCQPCHDGPLQAQERQQDHNDA